MYSNNVGPYMGVRFDQPAQDGRFRILVYQAYNAMGLIGPEHNGIVVLQEKPTKAVVADNIKCGEHLLDQIATAQELLDCSWERFKELAASSKRLRFDLDPPKKVLPKDPLKAYKTECERWRKHWDNKYDLEQAGTRFWRKVAKAVGAKCSYNRGGPAVCGDWYLTIPGKLELCAGAEGFGPGYVRKHVGDRNRAIDLRSFDSVVAQIREVLAT